MPVYVGVSCSANNTYLLNWLFASSLSIAVCGLFVDIDECKSGDNNCSQLCDNVPGSFECRCKAGYSLQDDGTTCEGMYAFMPVCVCVDICACVHACIYAL